jgi:hypothetical protein
MKFTLALAALMFLAGCDGYLAIKGELEVGEPARLPTECRARIEDEPIYGERQLAISEAGEFLTGWVVQPKRRTYRVVIVCPGFEEARGLAKYGYGGAPGEPFDLGKIRVEPVSK